MVILKTQMTVGPKGQVVIPKLFRDNMGLSSGSKVVVELEESKIVIERSIGNPVKEFERIAKMINSKEKIDSDKDYNEMMKQRWKKSSI